MANRPFDPSLEPAEPAPRPSLMRHAIALGETVKTLITALFWLTVGVVGIAGFYVAFRAILYATRLALRALGV